VPRERYAETMKYLLVGLLVAALAGVEFFHTFSADDGPDTFACMAPQSKADAIRDMLLVHLRSH
jgi:hypothetical protein